MLFDNWTGIGRTLLVGVLAYAALVLILRVSGKRTLTKLNAFDLVVTVALGSTLATIVLSESVALAEGVVAFLLLAGLQFVITWASVRSERFQTFVKNEPTLLLHHGRPLPRAMRQERITREELDAALRSAGLRDPAQAAAVVLESDGTLSVIKATPGAGEQKLPLLETTSAP